MEHTLNWESRTIEIESAKPQLWLESDNTLYISQRQAQDTRLYAVITVPREDNVSICTAQSFVCDKDDLVKFIRSNNLQEKEGAIIPKEAL